MREVEGDRDAGPHDDEAKGDGQTNGSPDLGGQLHRSSRRHDEEGEDEERSGDLADGSHHDAEKEDLDGVEDPHRESSCFTGQWIEGGEDERSGADAEHAQDHDRHDRGGEHFGTRDPEERAEQQGGRRFEEGGTEGTEEDAGSQCNGLNRAGGRSSPALSAEPSATARHRNCRRDEDGTVVAEEDGNTERRCRSSAWVGHEGERVAEEALLAEHHEPSHRSGHDRNEGTSDEGVAAVGVGPHCRQVGEEVPRRLRGHPCPPW